MSTLLNVLSALLKNALIARIPGTSHAMTRNCCRRSPKPLTLHSPMVDADSQIKNSKSAPNRRHLQILPILYLHLQKQELHGWSRIRKLAGRILKLGF